MGGEALLWDGKAITWQKKLSVPTGAGFRCSRTGTLLWSFETLGLWSGDGTTFWPCEPAAICLPGKSEQETWEAQRPVCPCPRGSLPRGEARGRGALVALGGALPRGDALQQGARAPRGRAERGRKEGTRGSVTHEESPQSQQKIHLRHFEIDRRYFQW